MDLSELAPIFYTDKGIHLYTPGSSSPEISGKSVHDFSNGPVQYTAAAEDGTNSKNYWVQVVKTTDGAGWLYMNSLADEDSDTKTENGIIYLPAKYFWMDIIITFMIFCWPIWGRKLFLHYQLI